MTSRTIEMCLNENVYSHAILKSVGTMLQKLIVVMSYLTLPRAILITNESTYNIYTADDIVNEEQYKVVRNKLFYSSFVIGIVILKIIFFYIKQSKKPKISDLIVLYKDGVRLEAPGLTRIRQRRAALTDEGEIRARQQRFRRFLLLRFWNKFLYHTNFNVKESIAEPNNGTIRIYECAENDKKRLQIAINNVLQEKDTDEDIKVLENAVSRRMRDER